MSVVGVFPGFREHNRRTIPAPTNPLDKSTIISIYPREIHEIKPTIQPGTFHIAAGTYEKPSITIVGPSSWWREIDEDQPLLEIPVNSIQIADALVGDFCRGLLACDMGENMPGLFYIPGEISYSELKTKYKSLLDGAKKKQDNWYKTLVKIADILWARTNGNPLSISDDARLAARELNLHDKPWLQDYKTVEMVPCKSCGTLGNPEFPVCANCKAIVNPERAKELGIKFAQ